MRRLPTCLTATTLFILAPILPPRTSHSDEPPQTIRTAARVRPSSITPTARTTPSSPAALPVRTIRRAVAKAAATSRRVSMAWEKPFAQTPLPAAKDREPPRAALELPMVGPDGIRFERVADDPQPAATDDAVAADKPSTDDPTRLAVAKDRGPEERHPVAETLRLPREHAATHSIAATAPRAAAASGRNPVPVAPAPGESESRGETHVAADGRGVMVGPDGIVFERLRATRSAPSPR